ncbi:MAG: ribonuclease P protein component [Chitinophagaceae bacterium]|nr:ribonuclease P protein component [Chitinophagaceae bacterium]
MAKEFTLGKNERLKHRKFIEQLFKEGRSFSVFPFRIFYLFTDELSAPLQAGFSASTRNFKKAVHRNRIKRITKEAYRIQKNELKSQLMSKNQKLAVFFIYTDKQLPRFKIVKERVQITLQKLITIIHEMDSPGS